MPWESQHTAYLEDFLEANESMDVFGDRNDLDLRPPPAASALEEPEVPPETVDHVKMSAHAFRNMIS